MGPVIPTNSTFTALFEAIEKAPYLPAQRRREMTSALNIICKVLDEEPSAIPASVSALQKKIHTALPMAYGVSAKRWRNCKSLLRGSLALIDPTAIPARSSIETSDVWKALLGHPACKPMRHGLARFSKWCSAKGIAPSGVDQEVFDLFLAELTQSCLLRSPIETQQTAGRAWNKAVAAVPGWPPMLLAIKNRRANPSLPWDAFPTSLEAEVEAYLNQRASSDLRFDLDEIVFRPSTIISKRAQLRQIATAIVESGVPPEKLAGLADIVEVDHVKAGLHILAKRAGRRDTGRIFGMAHMLLSVARYEVHASADHIKELENICKRARPKDGGEMTPKNRKLLEQFDDPENVRKYLFLPGQLMDAAMKLPEPTAAEARLAQIAVALEILTFAPLRIANVAQLELNRTLWLSGNGGHILVPYGDVKNKMVLELALPESVASMIKLYLKRFHPLLAPPGSKMLFPSMTCAHKHSTVLSTTIKGVFRDRCGIDLNVHAARHIAAKLFLEANPGQYGILMKVLGHKSIQTTIRRYCGTETAAAFRFYSAMIEQKRAKLKGWLS